MESVMVKSIEILLKGRRYQPYAFALSLVSLELGLIIFLDKSIWGNSGDWWSLLVASASVLTFLLLWWGFWMRSEAATRHALILSACVFAARGAYIGLVSGNWWTASLSWAWTVASAGAWLVEGAAPVPPHPPHDGQCCYERDFDTEG